MPFVALHGCVHHYDLAGRGDRPALLFANSLGSDLRIWDDLAGLIPGAKFSLIEEAAHLPCVEQPAAMAERMLEFFREVRIV